MTTKRPSQKQVIVLMNSKNTNNFMKELSSHVTNINRVLKNIKSKVMADFIHMKNSGLVIMTNKVASVLDLQTIEKYMKNTYNIKANYVESPRLPQSKSFLKIISISYILESTNTYIFTEKVKKLSKKTTYSTILFWLQDLGLLKYCQNWIYQSFGSIFGMSRMVQRPRDLSTNVSTLIGTLLVFVVLI